VPQSVEERPAGGVGYEHDRLGGRTGRQALGVILEWFKIVIDAILRGDDLEARTVRTL
jgi:hypothetical protein